MSDDAPTPDDAQTDPLHGVTLEALLEALVARHGWDGLARQVSLACFRNDPSVSSSLRFLRRTPWARAKVEAIYLADARRAERNRARNKRRAARRAFAAAVADGTMPPTDGEGPPPDGEA